MAFNFFQKIWSYYHFLIWTNSLFLELDEKLKLWRNKISSVFKKKVQKTSILAIFFEHCNAGNPRDISPVTGTVHTWQKLMAAVGVDKGCSDMPACISPKTNVWYQPVCSTAQHYSCWVIMKAVPALLALGKICLTKTVVVQGFKGNMPL